MSVDIIQQTAHCEYCSVLIGKVSNEWIDRYGFRDGHPKIVVGCKNCIQAELDGKVLIKGYGPVEPNMNTESSQGTSTRMKKISRTDLESIIDFDEISQLITDSNCRVNKLSEGLNANPLDVKQLLESHYGSRITFKRGRNGGVVWSE